MCFHTIGMTFRGLASSSSWPKMPDYRSIYLLHRARHLNAAGWRRPLVSTGKKSRSSLRHVHT